MTAGRLKLFLLLGGLVLSGVVILGWTQTWFVIAILGGPVLDVRGDVAAPALATLALTCIVLNGALSIAGPFFRVVLGSLEALLGSVVALSGVLALSSPIRASSSALIKATGVAGGGSSTEFVGTLSGSAWPWVSLAAGALLIPLGILVAASAKRWPSSGRKYSAVRLAPDGRDTVDDWDSLSDGNDPT